MRGLLALTAGPFPRFTLVALRAVHCSVLCAFRRVARRRCTLRHVEKLLYPPNPPLPAQVRQARPLVKEVRGCKSQALLHENASPTQRSQARPAGRGGGVPLPLPLSRGRATSRSALAESAWPRTGNEDDALGRSRSGPRARAASLRCRCRGRALLARPPCLGLIC